MALVGVVLRMDWTGLDTGLDSFVSFIFFLGLLFYLVLLYILFITLYRV